MPHHDEREIARFFSSVSNWEHLYGGSQISFLALKEGGSLSLRQAQVLLVGKWNQPLFESGVFETDRLVAGHVLLSTAGVSPEELVEGLRLGKITFLDRTFEFPRDDQGLSATFMEFDPDNVVANKRVPKLILTGRLNGPAPSKLSLDWHLRPMSYDSVDDLCAAFGVGAPDLQRPNVEMMAAAVSEMHVSSSVKGAAADLAIAIPADGDRAAATIAYKVFSPGGLQRRGSVSGEQLSWTAEGNVAVGVSRVEVPAGAAVQCFACYFGAAHQSVWLGDLSYSPNLRRQIFESIDEGLEVTKDFLFEEKRPRREARDLESGVAWLLWMAGFAVMHPGTKRLENSADLVAITPSSKILLVECTTGLLSREGKIPNLLHRVAALKKRLAEGGFAQVVVQGVGLTTKSRDELAADSAEAAKAGILLWTKDDLAQMLQKTVAPVNSDDLLEELHKRVDGVIAG